MLGGAAARIDRSGSGFGSDHSCVLRHNFSQPSDFAQLSASVFRVE
eukprot:COSAG03_NODE_16326_length_405_cov_0.709150_1_plen_45_part_01